MPDNDDEQRYAALAAEKRYPSLPEDFADRFVPRAIAARKNEWTRRLFWRAAAGVAALFVLSAGVGAVLFVPRGTVDARKRPVETPPQVAAAVPVHDAQPVPATSASSPQGKSTPREEPVVQQMSVANKKNTVAAVPAQLRQEKKTMKRKDAGKIAAVAAAAVSMAAPVSATFRLHTECASSAASAPVALEARASTEGSSGMTALESRSFTEAVSDRRKLNTTKFQGFIIMLK